MKHINIYATMQELGCYASITAMIHSLNIKNINIKIINDNDKYYILQIFLRDANTARTPMYLELSKQ